MKVTQNWAVIFVLAGLSAITATSIDILMPGNAVITRDLGAPEAQGALLIGSYFIAFAFGQLIWGLVSDAYGRRPVVLCLLAVFTLASIGCALATDFTWLIAFRVLQGFSGAVTVVAQAVVRDTTEGAASAKMLSVIALINSAAPMLAPIIGVVFLATLGWRFCFVFLAIFGMLLVLAASRTLPETVEQRRPERLKFQFIKSAIVYLLRQKDFVLGVGVMACVFGGFASLLSSGAVVTESAYGVSAEIFGLLFVIAAIAISLGVATMRYALGQYELNQLNTALPVVLGFLFLIQLSATITEPSLIVFWGSICIYTYVFGALLPFMQAKALGPAGDMPGFAASLMGSMTMAMGSLGSLSSALIYDETHRAVSLTMTTFLAASIALYMVVNRMGGIKSS